MKINPTNKKPVDSMFDGHLEKLLNKMTAKEKIDYLWMQIKFKHDIKRAKIIRNSNGKPINA